MYYITIVSILRNWFASVTFLDKFVAKRRSLALWPDFADKGRHFEDFMDIKGDFDVTDCSLSIEKYDVWSTATL